MADPNGADPNDILMGRVPPAPAPAVNGDPNDILMGRTVPTGPPPGEGFRGPLDPSRLAPLYNMVPLAVRPDAPVENPAFPSPSDMAKYPVSSAFQFMGSRVSSAAAPLAEVLYGNAPMEQSLGQVGQEALKTGGQFLQGLVLGKPPEPGMNPLTASYDVTSKYIQPALSEEQARAIDTRALGLPVGELARYLAGPGGASMVPESLAGGVLNKVGQAGVAPGARKLGRAVSATGIRQAPIVKEIGSAFAPGFGLGNDVRQEMRNRLRDISGSEALGTAVVSRQMEPYFKLVKAVSKETKVPVEKIERRIRYAVEMEPKDPRFMEVLSDKERQAAAIIKRRTVSDPNWREAAGLERFEQTGGITDLENVAFTKRVKSKELHEVFGGPKSQKVSRVQELAKLPTEEVEKILASEIGGKYAEKFAKGKVRGFRPLGESTMLAGQRTSQEVAHAKFIMKAADDFGKSFSDDIAAHRAGYINMGKLEGGPSGWTSESTAKLASKYIRKDQFEFLQEVNDAFKPSKISQMAGLHGKILRGIAETPRLWKSYVLLRPGFISRNFQNNIIMSAIYGNWNPKNYIDAFRTYVSNDKGSLAEMSRAIKLGVTGTGMFAKEINPEFLSETSKNVVLRGAAKGAGKFRAFNQAGEDVSKLALWKHFIKAGMSERDAADKVRNILFSYDPRSFTSFERKLKAGALPFYAWRRQIVPLLFRTLGERPGSIGQYEAFRQQFNKQQGLPAGQEKNLGPDVMSRGAFLKRYTGIAAKPGDFEVYPEGFLGLRDVAQMIGQEDKGVSAPIQRIVSDTYPWISTTISYLTPTPQRGDKANIGFDYYRGKPLTNAPVVLPEATKGLVLAFPDLASKLKITIDPKSKRVYGPDRVGVLLRTVGPVPTMLGDISSEDPQASRRARSFWTGISSMVRSLKTGSRIEKSERKRARDLRIQQRYQKRFFLKSIREPQK